MKLILSGIFSLALGSSPGAETCSGETCAASQVEIPVSQAELEASEAQDASDAGLSLLQAAMRSKQVKKKVHRQRSNGTRFNSPMSIMADLCAGDPIDTTTSMTKGKYRRIASSVTDLYESLPKTCTGTDCQTADFAGCVLRIAGHDFMDYKDGTGGSDGCMDLDDADNNGLAACMYEGENGVSLGDAYAEHCTAVSLADFFVIAAETVMTITRGNALNSASSTGEFDFISNFKFGRTTNWECDFAEGRLPNPENSCGAVEETFVSSMGLNWRQSAALMGVHTLGRAQIINSGYRGWWSDATNSRRFNNNYYVSMMAKGWIPETAIAGNSGKNQWERSDIGYDPAANGKEMMLNTDLCLLFSGDSCSGVTQASCRSRELNAATTDCCTWPTPIVAKTSYETYMDGEFCGTSSNIPGGADFGLQRRLCCCQGCDQSESRGLTDCGLPTDPNGPAASAVIDFANDEAVWMQAFAVAWTKATENGFNGLQSLTGR